jgi:hypothetical protein
MTSISFEAAIKLPDNDASNVRLGKLISARDFSASNLPTVADSYLHNFCNGNLSVTRRRWIGIALTGMLEMPGVAAHIGASTQQLRNLGAIILSSTEREQIKIIAGIIIRQALERGIEYSSFWSSEKVKHSAPSFPLEADAEWMQNFQSFLDALDDLALTKPTSEPSIVYLVSLFASDGFKWRESSNALPIVLIEAGVLTIIAPDEHLKECQFVEIPIEHILSTRSEPSKLYNSQAQHTEHEPWDLVMTLISQPWSYRLNSAQRIATDISLMFKHSGDALECKNCVQSHQKVHNAHSEALRILPIDASSPSIRSSNARRSLRSGSQPRRTERITAKKLTANGSDLTALLPRTESPRADSQASQELQLQHQSSISKRTTHSKGKLPRVSQAAKRKVLKLNSQPEDLDMPRESKRKAHTDFRHTSSAASSAQRKSQSSKAALSKKVTKSTSKARTSHSKHEADDDEDFIPSQTRPKKRTNPKRKAVSDTIAEDKPTKRPRIQPSKGVKSAVIDEKQHGQSHPPVKPIRPPSSVPSSQHTLIGGLLGTQRPANQRPANVSDLSFKKPTLPARAAQTPSTPTKPSRKLTVAPLRPQTPMEARMRSDDDALHYMASSPPVVEEAEESHEWHEIITEAAILSSNSKPMPASPNAESTAISGHADCDDVVSEKKTGDWQTAKSDPFSRRSVDKKVTSFLRRLTGEEPMEESADPEIGVSNRIPIPVAGSSTSEADALIAATRPRSQKWPRKERKPAPVEVDVSKARSRPKDAVPHTVTKDVDVELQQVAIVPDRAIQPPCRMQEAKKQRGLESPSQQNKDEKPDHDEAVTGNGTLASTFIADQQATKTTRNLVEETQRVMDQHQQVTETQQVIDSTPVKQAPDEDDVFFENDTLVGGEGVQQPANEFNASPITFPSSPPCPGSSSSHSSTSAVREPLTDSPVPTSQAEEMEWEASLQPHQRDLHELMIRTSKRVMRHIVNNETSVDDIAEMYAQDGEHVVSTLIQRHDTDYEHVFQGMESTKGNLQKELERAAKQMAKDRRRIITIA